LAAFGRALAQPSALLNDPDTYLHVAAGRCSISCCRYGIDGRIGLFGNDFLARYLEAGAGDEDVLVGLIDRYGITWTLLRPRECAVRSLDGLPGWRRAYSDNIAVIHRRDKSVAPPTPLTCPASGGG